MAPPPKKTTPPPDEANLRPHPPQRAKQPNHQRHTTPRDERTLRYAPPGAFLRKKGLSPSDHNRGERCADSLAWQAGVWLVPEERPRISLMGSLQATGEPASAAAGHP